MATGARKDRAAGAGAFRRIGEQLGRIPRRCGPEWAGGRTRDGGSTVREHGFAGDSVCHEEGFGAEPNRCGSSHHRIGEDFGAGQPWVIIRGVVQVGVDGPGPAFLSACGPSQAAKSVALWEAY